MKNLLILLLVCTAFKAKAQFNAHSQHKIDYLKENRFDLSSARFKFPQKDFKIIGFGAYHGSGKTEEAEHLLLKSLTTDGTLKYYIPETDFSIAYYFNDYLNTGDTVLLKDLIYTYGIRVPQEKTIETYNKWKGIKRINDSLPTNKKLTIVGLDAIVSYKYTSKLLLKIINYQSNPSKTLEAVVNMVVTNTTDFSPYYDSYSKGVLKRFVSDYEEHPAQFINDIKNKFIFDHIITNLKYSFDGVLSRDSIMFINYSDLSDSYKFDQEPQFFRLGFFHLEKSREGANVPFFAMLIESKTYKRNQVLSVIGYLTKSRVLWNITRDDQGNYKAYKTKGGFGIGDYKKEYFLGIANLKKARLSGLTLFQLNKIQSPYHNKIPDLIEIVTSDELSNSKDVIGKSTVDFLDFAILISRSKASIPIQEMR